MANRIVIVLAKCKGGTGKTTSAIFIALLIPSAWLRLIEMDVNPDESWLKWHSSEALPYSVVSGGSRDLTDQVDQILGAIVIDTPSNDGEIIYKAAIHANEAIIPLAPPLSMSVAS